MNVSTQKIASSVNILFNDHVVSENITLDFTSVTTTADNGLKVVKAGTPVNASGKKATTTTNVSDAVGILLHDCYEDNPNTALIIHGFIDTEKAKANSGVTIDDATKEALPMIAFY